ncbi:MAG: leucine--tRNA ligase [Bacteroidetes bacterium]|nr:MAG: leucine--tRNA ligase [Bacteroidota bacterium]PIE87895.1 MAG: leucine--tRNA ligase [Bacteroidota bacterium]
MDYNHLQIEQKWQRYWAEHKTFKADNQSDKPKFYVLDMFPYPSGAGLHVGHPLGYIASDIYARYMRHKGYNVLHPMGYDAYGLPAEQYAIQTGTHPAVTTAKNIARYRQQLDRIGFSYDWDREVQTCDPSYYKWTQWTFIQLFNSWYDRKTEKAQPIEKLIALFEEEGNVHVDAACSEMEEPFTADEWRGFDEKTRQERLMHYRLAFLADSWVNWCPVLGTVLANDEVKEGLSERGGHPVERKRMRQWSLRITAYAQRLLDGLETVDWSESIKEVQRNWIGRSEGASVNFSIDGREEVIEVFTTRPDTLYGATFMVLAPEHELVPLITTAPQKEEVEAYVAQARNRSERERMTEVKKVTGVFTGAYGVNPITGEKLPIWIADYVLSGYGTGAIMAVPAHDSRDFAFARQFQLPIIQVVCAHDDTPSDPAQWEESYDSKEGRLIHSEIINGLDVKEAISKIIKHIEDHRLGYGKVNYRLRDAIFSRQRYWGEPFPVYYKDDMPYMMDEEALPVELPEVDKYLPTEEGEPPLARAKGWQTEAGAPMETNTMPGFAGSSGYYLRYMDPHNKEAYFSKEAAEYWQQVDLYLGGDEHATGHLIYARFWNKFLFDIGIAPQEEPFKKLINQGKIQGRSNFVYRINGTNTFVSYGLRNQYETTKLYVDINLVHNDVLDVDAFRNWREEYADAEFLLEEGKYVCGWEVEKMSKSKYNVQSPDELVEHYGADTLRLYEMFLGPLEASKPWDTNGIEGVFRFLKKVWKLYHHNEHKAFEVSEEAATPEERKVLHKAIKKIEEDIVRFSFNTAVSTYMICVNELTNLKCNKREILEPLAILLSPYASHMAEELWQLLGHKESIEYEPFPSFVAAYVEENTFAYPVSFNGKMRFKITLPLDMGKEEAEKAVMASEEAQRWLEGKTVRKVIVVPGRIINVVVS